MNSALQDTEHQDRQRLRLAIADATSTVGALEDEIARLQGRLRLAKAHARQLNDEYFLTQGAYPS